MKAPSFSQPLARRVLVALAFGWTLLAWAPSVSAQTEIVLGLGTGLTGACADYGQQSRRGVEAAVADANARGGVGGRTPVRLLVADDACDPKQAVSAANGFAGKGVRVVIGHLYSGASIAASDVYREEGIVMITGSASSPQLTERGLQNVFRAAGRDDQQAGVAADHLLQGFRGKRVGILHDKSAYGKGLADAVKAGLNAGGMTEALYETVNPGEKDYSAVVSRLKATNLDAIYFGGYYPEAGLILRQAASQGFRFKMLGGDGLQSAELWAIAGDAAQGTLFTYAPDPRENLQAKTAVEKLRAGGVEPAGFTLYYYAAAQVALGAIEKAGSLRAEDLQKALRSNIFETVAGPMAFDAKGDLKTPGYVLYEWRDGRGAMLSSKGGQP